MFWTIAATLTLEWLTAVACHFTLHGLINGLLWLAAVSLLLALASRMQGDARAARQSHRFAASQLSLVVAVVRDESAVLMELKREQ